MWKEFMVFKTDQGYLLAIGLPFVSYTQSPGDSPVFSIRASLARAREGSCLMKWDS
jgi:hypothetical protein